MTILTTLVLVFLVTATPPGMGRASAMDPPLPTRLGLAFTPAGAVLGLGAAAGHAFGLPAGGSVELALDACDPATGTCNVASPTRLGRFGDLLPPVPLTLHNVPLCLRIRPSGASGEASYRTGAVELALPSSVDLHLTSIGSVCPTCEDGTCAGGLVPGAPCGVEAEASILVAGVEPVPRTLRLSRDCPPGDAPVSRIDTMIALTTTTSPGGAFVAATSAQDATCGQPAGIGVGAASTPDPAWPDATLPKAADLVLAGGACMPSSGVVTVDAVYGLPGPLGLRLPVHATWHEAQEPIVTVTEARRHIRVVCRDPGAADACDAFGLMGIDAGTPAIATSIGHRRFRRREQITIGLRLTRAARARLRSEGRLDVRVVARVGASDGGGGAFTNVGSVALDR